MEIDNQRIAANSQRTGPYFVLDRGEGVIHRIHENAAHEIDDEHAGAGRGFDEIGATAGRSARVVERPDETRLAGDENERLALIERMISKGYAIGARRDEVGANRLGDPESARRVLAIDDHAIEPPRQAQFGQMFQQSRAARPPDDVTDEQEAHAKVWPGSRSTHAP